MTRNRAKMDRTLIIDANNMLWRGSIRSPLSHNGVRTEAIHTCLAMMRSYLIKFEPDSCILVWDGGRDKRRTTKYSDYKRKKKELTPVEKREKKILFSQADFLQLGLELLGMSQSKCIGFEADDVIFNLVKASEPKTEAVIISTDEDMFQLFTVKKNLIVYSPIKDKVITKSDVEEKFGFPIDYFTTYKALAGDSSDNIPGIKGIGPVKAKRIIDLFQADTDGWDFSDINLMSEFHSQFSKYEKMLDLVKFKDIEDHELVNGFWERIPDTKEALHSSAHMFLTACGFKKHLDDFVEFMAPFDRYWERVH